MRESARENYDNVIVWKDSVGESMRYARPFWTKLRDSIWFIQKRGRGGEDEKKHASCRVISGNTCLLFTTLYICALMKCVHRLYVI